tara:strand:+ start:475 stop:1170 length:696 start_codon:yes stop_codon:yes gene_type:complete
MSELVFVGEGQLALSHKHDDIAIREQTEMSSANVANAVVIKMRKATIDAKLGAFTQSSDTWAEGDSAGFDLSAAELVTEIEAQGGATTGIATVGGLSDELANFKTSVMAIFNAGSETLFEEEAFDALSTNFGPAEMLALMKLSNAQAPTSTLKVKNMNKVLRDAVDRGHNGRDSSSEVSDGFKADDKLYFADGVRLNISVAFANEETNPPANLSAQSLQVAKDNDLVIQVV